ncbi:MAG: hypothetical protein IJX98_01195 [Clostridia bacterium]|nr:hypothetical protein [Clostridia bacterium]
MILMKRRTEYDMMNINRSAAKVIRADGRISVFQNSLSYFQGVNISFNG